VPRKLSFTEDIQNRIRKERERLSAEKEKIKRQAGIVEQKISALQRQCSHPNASWGVKEPFGKTMDCPDCGYGVLYIEDEEKPYRRRGRPPKTDQ
jgi:hypothetical protein